MNVLEELKKLPSLPADFPITITSHQNQGILQASNEELLKEANRILTTGRETSSALCVRIDTVTEPQLLLAKRCGVGRVDIGGAIFGSKWMPWGDPSTLKDQWTLVRHLLRLKERIVFVHKHIDYLNCAWDDESLQKQDPILVDYLCQQASQMILANNVCYNHNKRIRLLGNFDTVSYSINLYDNDEPAWPRATVKNLVADCLQDNKQATIWFSLGFHYDRDINDAIVDKKGDYPLRRSYVLGLEMNGPARDNYAPWSKIHRIVFWPAVGGVDLAPRWWEHFINWVRGIHRIPGIFN